MAIKGTETVTILRRIYNGDTDAYGNDVPTNLTLEVKGVLIGWGSTGDSVTTIGETVDTSATLYFPKGTVILNDDRFLFPDGTIWLHSGRVIEWVSPKGSPVKTKPIVEVTKKEG